MKGADGVEKTVWDRLFIALVTAIYIFLMFPIVLVVLLSFNSGEFLAFPLEGFSLRWFESLFSNKRFLDATLYSVRIAAISTIVNGVIGTLAAIETLKEILKLGESLAGRLLLYDGLAAQFRTIALPADPQCPDCSAIARD